MSQCTAHRKNGDQCKAPSIKGASVCRIHGGMAPQVRRRAALRLLEASDSAAALLVKIVESEKVPTDLRLRAARDLLDRAGLSGKERIEVEVIPREPAPWERLVAQTISFVDTDADRPAARIVYTPEPVAELEMRSTPASSDSSDPGAYVPPSDSLAAQAMYEANRDIPDPEPKDWTERVDGARPRQRRRRT